MLLTCFPALLLTRPAGNGDDNSTLARTLACMHARTHPPGRRPSQRMQPPTQLVTPTAAMFIMVVSHVLTATKHVLHTTLSLPDPTTATTLFDPDRSKAPLGTFVA